MPGGGNRSVIPHPLASAPGNHPHFPTGAGALETVSYFLDTGRVIGGSRMASPDSQVCAAATARRSRSMSVVVSYQTRSGTILVGRVLGVEVPAFSWGRAEKPSSERMLCVADVGDTLSTDPVLPANALAEAEKRREGRVVDRPRDHFQHIAIWPDLARRGCPRRLQENLVLTSSAHGSTPSSMPASRQCRLRGCPHRSRGVR